MSPILPIIQRCINAATIPLWIIALTMLVLAVRAAWSEFFTSDDD